MRSRSANWPARSAGTHLHARSRWSGSRPGDQNRATTSHLRQNPRRWRSDLHQGDHTQLDGFPSEMRCRGVALLASRISVPSPATPCTLFTPNGAPRGLISRICLLSFAGANTEACLRMVTQSHLSTLHLDFAHRRTVHQDAGRRSPLRVPTRAGGPHRKNSPLQRTSRPFNALRATVRPRRRLPCTLACHYQVTSAQSKPAPAAVAATRAWQLEEGRNVEMTGCTSEAAAQYHQGCISSAPRGNSCHPPLGMPAASSHAVHFGGLQRSSRDF